MAFGMQTASTPDFNDIIKFDANAGRMFRIDYNLDTREKVPTDITGPPAARFAVDFGSLEIGYGRFTATGPEFHIVPVEQKLPAQPLDKDDKGRAAVPPGLPGQGLWQDTGWPARVGIVGELCARKRR